jgi:hypothetical protein
MAPTTFCHDTLLELAPFSHNDAWVRGAHAVCDMYAGADAVRFEGILRRLAVGTSGSALTLGATWLLKRWQVAQLSQ